MYGDAQGTVQTTTLADGSIEAQRDYTPFGEQRGANPGFDRVPNGYTGHEEDTELGLVNMRGRIYDPAIGQFLQADPIIAAPFSQGLNRYAYVGNSPLNATDPSGFYGRHDCPLGFAACGWMGFPSFGLAPSEGGTVADTLWYTAAIGITGVGGYALSQVAFGGGGGGSGVTSASDRTESGGGSPWTAANDGLATLGATANARKLANPQTKTRVGSAPPLVPGAPNHGQGSANASRGTGSPTSPNTIDQVVSAIENEIDQGQFTNAILKAMDFWSIQETPDVRWQWNPNEVPGKSATTTLANGHTSVSIYNSTFRNGGRWLLSTVFHENVHVEQIRDGRFADDSDTKGSALNEVEAYDAELRQSARLGLSPSQVQSTVDSRNREYNKLDSAYKRQVTQGNFVPRTVAPGPPPVPLPR